MIKKFNPFHLVEVSPWPLLASNGAIVLVISGLVIENNVNKSISLISLLIVSLIAFMW